MYETHISATIGSEDFKTEIHTPDHILIADEPTLLGGRNTGATPHQLLLASLGACTLITLKMYANRKE